MNTEPKKPKKPETPQVQWRYPYKTGSEPNANSPAKNGKAKRSQANRPKKYATKKGKTVAKANPLYKLHPECDSVFANKVHALRFRMAMLSTRARELISVFDQLELAAKVEAEIDALEIKLGRSVPSDIVAELVDAFVMDMERAAA